MTPVNVSQEKMEILAQTFRCAIGTMPFTYLGLSMGTKKSRMEDLTPTMDRVERCLSSTATWLSYSGRLQDYKLSYQSYCHICNVHYKAL
jgi:hypothetical protein